MENNGKRYARVGTPDQENWSRNPWRDTQTQKRLYDRRNDDISVGEVERIGI
jgi:hypothetical protein